MSLSLTLSPTNVANVNEPLLTENILDVTFPHVFDGTFYSLASLFTYSISWSKIIKNNKILVDNAARGAQLLGVFAENFANVN